MSADLFLKIVAREIPADIVYETDEVLAFRDINPQAPIHVLVIPNRRIASTDQLDAGDSEIAGRLLLAAAAVAREQGIDQTGYRIVVNCGDDGGRTVDHIHLHVLGGRQLGWPPG